MKKENDAKMLYAIEKETLRNIEKDMLRNTEKDMLLNMQMTPEDYANEASLFAADEESLTTGPRTKSAHKDLLETWPIRLEVIEDLVARRVAAVLLQSSGDRARMRKEALRHTAVCVLRDVDETGQTAIDEAQKEINAKTAEYVAQFVSPAVEQQLAQYTEIRADHYLKRVFQPTDTQMQHAFQLAVRQVVDKALGDKVQAIGDVLTTLITKSLAGINVTPTDVGGAATHNNESE